MYTTEGRELLEWIDVEGPALAPMPPRYQGRVMVHVIHDGDVIPETFLWDRDGKRIPEEIFLGRHVAERDWGAGLVAGEIARAMGLGGYNSVSIARVLMDFGRFPGSTAGTIGHLLRYAINHPFSELLDHRQKRLLLADWYDALSRAFDSRVRGKLLTVAVHTYDPRNSNGTLRPKVSLINRVDGFDHDAPVTHTAFDPLYPHILGEFTAHRVLRDRISLTLERRGIGVGHDYPYLLPEGSIEVRGQVWSFFDWVGRRFTQAYPETLTDPSYHMVWEMLLDTNHRSSTSAALRAYLHRYRTAPDGRERAFAGARDAYERVAAFIRADDHRIVEEFRFSPHRPSFLGIEVRKDVVMEFDDRGRPAGPRQDAAKHLGEAIAEAISHYLAEDRPLQKRVATR